MNPLDTAASQEIGMQRTYFRSYFFLFLVTLLWLPLPLGSNRIWAISLFELAVFICFLGLALQIIKSPDLLSPVIKKYQYALYVLIFGCTWPLIQYVLGLSASPDDTFYQGILGLAYACWFLISLQCINTFRRVKWVVVTLVISALLQVFFGYFMVASGIEWTFFVPKEYYLANLTGTFINRNHVGNYLVLCCCMGIGLLIGSLSTYRSSNWRHLLKKVLSTLLSPKAPLRFALIIIVIGIVLTHSRMSNSAFFISLLITSIFSLVFTRKRTKTLSFLLFSFIAVDILIVGSYFGVSTVIERIDGTSFERETRDDVDRLILPMIKAEPLVGTGAGTFYTTFPEYRTQEIKNFYNHAHNDYLEFMVERGLIGAIPLMFILSFSLYLAVTAHIKRKNQMMRGISFGGVMAIIAMSLHALVDFNLQIPANAATFLLCLALCWIAASLKEKKRRRT